MVGKRKKTCSIDGCDNLNDAKTYCSKHYYRYRKFGTTEIENAREMHGMFGTPEYNTWASIVQRTTDTGWYRYKDWGGRGIKMCPEWRKSFLAFYRDMGPRPKGYSINRIDNDGNYELSNCEWTDKYHQARNKRVQTRNTSGVTGVNWHRSAKNWRAYIRVEGKLHHLGAFTDKQDAIKARRKAEHKFDFFTK